MRQGVVLLFTLGVIALTSLLILQNYDAIDRFITKKENSTSRGANFVQTKNVQEQIVQLLHQNEENLDMFLPLGFLHLPIGDLQISIEYIKFYDRYLNLNGLDDTVLPNYRFINYVKNAKPKESKYENSKQVQDIIRNYLLAHEDNQIKESEQMFTFFERSEKTIECEFQIMSHNKKTHLYFIYDLEASEVKDFELWQ